VVAALLLVVCGYVVFIKPPRPEFQPLAMLTARVGTNEAANAEKLKHLLHLLPPVPGDTNPPRRTILMLLPDFQKLTVRFKLADDSELSGSLTPLPAAGTESDTLKFRVAASGATKSGEAVEVEGNLEVTSTKTVKSAGELKWKNIGSARVTLQKPAPAELGWSRP
jgi:hypothetical protein